MKFTQLIVSTAFWFVAFAATTVSAEFSPAETVKTEHAFSELLVERQGFAPGETTWFALRQELQLGWHVYWKNPGDSGLPLSLTWTLPEGYTAGEPVYPTPERIIIEPLANYGHHGEPVFMAAVTAPEDAQVGDEIVVEVSAFWLICAEICVPEEGQFRLTLPVVEAPTLNTRGAAIIEEARTLTPVSHDGAAVFSAHSEKMELQVDWANRPAPRDVYFFPVLEGLVEPVAAQTFTVQDGSLTIGMTPGYGAEISELDEIEGVLRVSNNSDVQGYEINATIDESVAVSPGRQIFTGNNVASVPLLLVMAFFGGVLLNIMPCVFPILFIKAASVVKSAHGEQSIVRRHGLLYTAGVLATFAALGGLLLALRAGGQHLGWGFHLQSPIVVGFSAYILFLVGLSLAGLFHVGENLQGVGSGMAGRGGSAGAFFTGVLAVFVAAPCIGPLLSAPMGAAILLPPAIGMLIFLLMALGLAAPYLAISFSPALGRMLPRPGPWMEVFKQTLSFPVFAAAAFLLWVLASQTGVDGLAKALTGAIFLAFAAWLFEKSKGDGKRALFVRIGAGVAILLALAPLSQLKTAEAASSGVMHYGAIDAEVYDEGSLDSLRAAGRPVFIDFTAAWCVTCQFDRITIFSKNSVARAFEEMDVTLMVADWTSRDPVITEALESFNANGVPLYVYYPPTGSPQVLPLPLTENTVLRAIKDGEEAR